MMFILSDAKSSGLTGLYCLPQRFCFNPAACSITIAFMLFLYNCFFSLACSAWLSYGSLVYLGGKALEERG